VISDCTEATRPRLEARRRAFLDAATAVFLEKGYANATLDDVIARSGGSRQTLYSLFGGKQGLFEALVAERCNKIFAPLCAEDLLDRAPDEVLVDLGVRYLEAVTTPDALGVYRLVVAEGVFMKDLAERFWNTGPGRSRALLAAYLEQQARRGTLRLHDPERAAQQFWGMLLGQYQMQCLLGLREAPESSEIAVFVQTAVTRFLDGCRADDGGSRAKG
jgi:TetR/AcrR family transcriptional repressor of mexJK operon